MDFLGNSRGNYEIVEVQNLPENHETSLKRSRKARRNAALSISILLVMVLLASGNWTSYFKYTGRPDSLLESPIENNKISLFAMSSLQSPVRKSFLFQYEAEIPEEVSTSMNFSVDPCTNFYEHVCGRWIESAEIPPDKGSVSKSWDGAENRVKSRLKKIFEVRVHVSFMPNTLYHCWLKLVCPFLLQMTSAGGVPSRDASARLPLGALHAPSRLVANLSHLFPRSALSPLIAFSTNPAAAERIFIAPKPRLTVHAEPHHLSLPPNLTAPSARQVRLVHGPRHGQQPRRVPHPAHPAAGCLSRRPKGSLPLGEDCSAGWPISPPHHPPNTHARTHARTRARTHTLCGAPCVGKAAAAAARSAAPTRSRGRALRGAGGPDRDTSGPRGHAGVPHVLEHPHLLRLQRRHRGPPPHILAPRRSQPRRPAPAPALRAVAFAAPRPDPVPPGRDAV